MTPEEQTQFVELQDKLAAAEKERDEHAAKIDELGKDLDDLRKINNQLFLRVTAPPPGKDEKPDKDETTFTSDNLLSELTKTGGK